MQQAFGASCEHKESSWHLAFFLGPPPCIQRSQAVTNSAHLTGASPGSKPLPQVPSWSPLPHSLPQVADIRTCPADSLPGFFQSLDNTHPVKNSQWCRPPPSGHRRHYIVSIKEGGSGDHSGCGKTGLEQASGPWQGLESFLSLPRGQKVPITSL